MSFCRRITSLFIHQFSFVVHLTTYFFVITLNAIKIESDISNIPFPRKPLNNLPKKTWFYFELRIRFVYIFSTNKFFIFHWFRKMCTESMQSSKLCIFWRKFRYFNRLNGCYCTCECRVVHQKPVRKSETDSNKPKNHPQFKTIEFNMIYSKNWNGISFED